jgi:UrcA family protein
MKVILIAAVGAVLAGPAMAYELKTQADGDQVRVVKLATDRVDFNDRAAVKAFYAKVKAAANEACARPSTSASISRPDQDCVADAVRQAVRAADRPQLTAAYTNDRGVGVAFAGQDN